MDQEGFWHEEIIRHLDPKNQLGIIFPTGRDCLTRTREHPLLFIDIKFTKHDYTASKVQWAGRMAEGGRFGASLGWAEP
jgi:hypothetical protein